MAAYYNEIDLYAAEWLRNLIKAGHIADGEVDTRSIIDVQPEEIKDFDQCHFFAGIAGWSHALRLSGWKDDRKIWTGSCPCQPFSVAGQGKGTDDPRHLWPHFFRLIRGCRPSVVMGEQVAGAAGYGWLDGVRSDLESESYAIKGVDIPACSANAPHIRQRLYWVAHSKHTRWNAERLCGHGEAGQSMGERQASSVVRSSEDGAQCMANTKSDRREHGIFESRNGHEGNEPPGSGLQFANNSISNIGRRTSNAGFWDNAIWLNGADGKTRRAQPDICLLAHGVPARVGKLRAYGNAIVPPLAAEVIKAFMEETK